jgi:ubiquinone/menaquinone biosynthesis C-methylase UbiE
MRADTGVRPYDVGMSKRYRHIAEYYDAEYGGMRMLEEDVPFFMGQLPRKRLEILELCVGTGRAAIPLAQAGHRVVGVDYAPDMLELARRKRDSVGLGERELRLLNRDVLKLDLKKRFDWVCIFFNTFLAFTTLEEQDRVLRAVVRHMKPKGRFWVDIFQPDIALIADPKLEGQDASSFFVPSLNRTVFKTHDIYRTGPQTERVVFRYAWFDEMGSKMQASMDIDITFMFERELRLLLERNGLRVERIWGNYDGSGVKTGSPRLIARCCRM